MKLQLELSNGSISGQALYITDEDGGTRLVGGKCNGFINPVKTWDMQESDLEHLIDTAKIYLKKLKKYNKEQNE